MSLILLIRFWTVCPPKARSFSKPDYEPVTLFQILNSHGARYPIQPVGPALVDRLCQKHAPQCDHEFWDLAEGDFTISFVPNE